MASIINASTTLGLQHSADTSGVLKLQTASTDAVTIDASQNITLNTGTANGVAYLNGSKVLTTNGVLSFDGTTLTSTRFAGALSGSVGATTPSTGAFTTLSASTSFTEAGYNVVTQADIGSAANEIPLNQYLGKLAFKNTVGLYATENVAPTIASAATIQPQAPIVFISGTTTISTITVPPEFVGGGRITLIPTGLWSTNTSGNIALGTTGVVSKALIMTYDAGTAKWYPSY